MFGPVQLSDRALNGRESHLPVAPVSLRGDMRRSSNGRPAMPQGAAGPRHHRTTRSPTRHHSRAPRRAGGRRDRPDRPGAVRPGSRCSERIRPIGPRPVPGTLLPTGLPTMAPTSVLGSADLMERNLDRRVEAVCGLETRRRPAHPRGGPKPTFARPTGIRARGRHLPCRSLLGGTPRARNIRSSGGMPIRAAETALPSELRHAQPSG